MLIYFFVVWNKNPPCVLEDETARRFESTGRPWSAMMKRRVGGGMEEG